MPYCATCATRLEPGHTHCPDCGAEVLRIVDARPGTTYTMRPGQRAAPASGATAGEVVTEMVNRGISYMWSIIWILVFWGAGVVIAFSMFGSEMSGWWVLSAGVLAAIGEQVLSRWWGGVKAKAAANESVNASR